MLNQNKSIKREEVGTKAMVVSNLLHSILSQLSFKTIVFLIQYSTQDLHVNQDLYVKSLF